MPGIAATGSASAAAVQPEPSSGAVDEASVAGAAEDQLAGTDRPPTVEASAKPADIPPPPTLLTRAPSAATPPASGVTESTVDHGTAGIAPTVCPNDTAVGMVLPTNHAAVTPNCWTKLKLNSVPKKPSAAFSTSAGPGNAVEKAFHISVPKDSVPKFANRPLNPVAALLLWADAKAVDTAAPWVAAAAGLAVGDAGVSG